MDVNAPGDAELIRAAGGVVWRRRSNGRLEVAMVHRPAYDDWTFPKGKLLAGEEDEAAALREVLEETGLVCRLGPYLTHLSYRDRKDRPKTVRYWAMSPLEGEFTANGEVDVLRWVSMDDAGLLLTYDHDRHVLERLLEVLPGGEEASRGG